MKTIWEYDTLVCSTNLELDRELNSKGKYGWEAYAVVHKQYPSGDEVIIAHVKRGKNNDESQ